jgi:hypothetical protein
LQPVEIGKKLERAMLENQRASVGSSIVPNAYVVRLNPRDYAQIEGYAAGLSRQMESWLFGVASKRQLTVLAKIEVSFVEDSKAPQRNPRIDASITDHVAPPSPQRRQPRGQQRGAAHRPAAPRYTPAEATSVFHVPTRPSGALQFRAIAGAVTDSTFTIPEGTSTIGRSDENTIVLDLPDVSRRHARLERAGLHLRIYDLNSTNGTRVNGEAVHISDVQEGDHVQIGSQVLELISGSPWDDEGRRS